MPTRITTSPLAQIAADILDELRTFMDPCQAQTWLLSAQQVFVGKSPVMMIREGRVEDVRAVVAKLKQEQGEMASAEYGGLQKCR
jgi:hypothetical protein